jgi:hypothetical protein
VPIITPKQARQLGIETGQHHEKPKDIWRRLVKPTLEEALKNLMPDTNPLPGIFEEFLFCDGRKWRFDLAIPELRMAVEYEGVGHPGQKTRHTSIVGYSNDCEKYSTASGVLGWRLVRVTALMTRPKDGRAVSLIHQTLAAAITSSEFEEPPKPRGTR